MNTLSVLAPSAGWLMICRMPAGFALGAVVATVMMTAGRSDRPEQTFGFINAMVGVMGMVIAFILPRALGLHEILPRLLEWDQVDGLFLVYALCALCALPFIIGTPPTPPVNIEGSGGKRPSLRNGWLGLCGLGVVFFGHGQLGLFIVKIGRSIELSAETIGYVFMAGSLAGIGLPLLAGYIGSRMNAAGPIGVILTVIVLAAILLGNAETPLAFFIAAPVFAMLPIAIMPIFLGCLARVDPTGSLAGAHAAFLLIGGAVAPFVGGTLSDLGGYALNGYAVAACVLLGSGLMYKVIRQADAIRTNNKNLDTQHEQSQQTRPA
jgi:predicted MFS family arabinose efflux permease